MRPAPVVPRLDIFHDGRPRRKMILKIGVVIHLRFQVREEIFGYGVIPTHPGQPHGLGDFVSRTPLLKLPGGILRASVAMENCAIWMKSSVVTGHAQRVDNQRRAHVRIHGPTDHHTCGQIDHGGQIQPAGPRLQIRDVPNEPGARDLGGEVPLPVLIEHMVLDVFGACRGSMTVVRFHARIRLARNPALFMIEPTVPAATLIPR